MATFLRRDDWVTDAMGNAISGASVYVCSQPASTGSIPPSPEVQLYSDPAGANPITQPVITDGYGHAAYYVTPGTYTVVYYSPQIQEVVLPDQTIGSGNVAFPITIPQGGTNATTAAQARINLGAAANGANSDITSLLAVGSPGGANTTSTFNSTGWQFGLGGTGNFGTGGGTSAYVANQNWTGSGYSGIGMAVQDSGGGYAIMGSSGFYTSGGFTGGNVHVLGTLSVNGGQLAQIDTIESFTVNHTLALTGQGMTGAGSVSVSIGGNGNLGQALLGFANYPTQTTVGAAGGASALPATPAGYLPISIGGTEFVIPYYAKS